MRFNDGFGIKRKREKEKETFSFIHDVGMIMKKGASMEEEIYFE